MELKDVVLSTLAEMQEIKPKSTLISSSEPSRISVVENVSLTNHAKVLESILEEEEEESFSSDELNFLTSMRERLLVLFEGFQAPNNANIEAKLDMTLNFLEYVLANIDSRIEEIKSI